MLIHPPKHHQATRPSKRRVTLLWRALFAFTPGRTSRMVYLLAAGVLLSGCAVGSFELTRPDGVTVKANAFAIFRDTGLENFTYTVTEDENGAGLLPSKATRNASVGASGYSGTTRAETLLKLLEALP